MTEAADACAFDSITDVPSPEPSGGLLAGMLGPAVRQDLAQVAMRQPIMNGPVVAQSQWGTGPNGHRASDDK
jgi:hypothetical protein